MEDHNNRESAAFSVNISRRKFLKGSIATTAAVSVGSFMPDRAAAQLPMEINQGGSMPIIDAHVHVLNNYVAMAPLEDIGRHDRLLWHMDECGVEKAVMLPVLADFSPKNNEECAQLAREYPDRLVTLTYVHLGEPNAAEQIARARGEFGAVGIICYPSPRDIKCMTDPACEPVWEAFSANDLVCNLQIAPPNYAILLDLARTHTDIRFVCNHMGLPHSLKLDDDSYGGLMEAASLPNLFVKASAFYSPAARSWDFRCPRSLGFFSNLLKGLGADRLLWGSDWPSAGNHVTYRQTLETVRTFAVDLDDESRALVLGGNAARVFKI